MAWHQDTITYPSTSGTTSRTSGPNTHPTIISAISAGHEHRSKSTPNSHRHNSSRASHSTSTISSMALRCPSNNQPPLLCLLCSALLSPLLEASLRAAGVFVCLFLGLFVWVFVTKDKLTNVKCNGKSALITTPKPPNRLQARPKTAEISESGQAVAQNPRFSYMYRLLSCFVVRWSACNCCVVLCCVVVVSFVLLFPPLRKKQGHISVPEAYQQYQQHQEQEQPRSWVVAAVV